MYHASTLNLGVRAEILLAWSPPCIVSSRPQMLLCMFQELKGLATIRDWAQNTPTYTDAKSSGAVSM